jgi:Leucine-rich repeat (LRR) protein
MSDVPNVRRPQRISLLKTSMAELGRASALMRGALRESNDERYQAFFSAVIERIEMIVLNERDGITVTLADDLTNVRSALRRLRIPDIDPDLEAPTPALKSLRSERGNLIESIDNALDAAAALRLHPRSSEFGGIYIERQEIAEQLIRLDERLRAVQDAVVDLRGAAAAADETPDEYAISQSGLVNVHIKTLNVEVSAARFETQVGSNTAIPPITDISALTRSIEVMNEIAGDLKQVVESLGGLVATGVRAAGVNVVKNVERSWRGLKTVVSSVRRRLRHKSAVESNAYQHPPRATKPPADFDLGSAHKMILEGRPPPVSWSPWIDQLEFDGEKGLSDLAPLMGLSALQTLVLDRTQVSDLAPIAGLSALRRLSLERTQVGDLTPLAGLSALQALVLDHTRASDLTPLVGLSALQRLSLNNTLVSDLAPLARLSALQTLDLQGTSVGNLARLAGLSKLQTLSLSNTQVTDLAPLARLSTLQALDFDHTGVKDLTPLAKIRTLQTVSLRSTQVTDLAPLAELSALQTLSLDGTLVTDFAPLLRLSTLQNLSLSYTQVADLAPLAQLSALRSLKLDRTQLSDYAPLARFSALQNLSLIDASLNELTPLTGLKVLQSLSLDLTHVSDLAPLAELTALQTLSLNNTQVSNLWPLAKLSALNTLFLDATQVVDLTPLSNLSVLRTLSIENTPVSDLAPLTKLPSLISVWVESDARRAALAKTLGEDRPQLIKIIAELRRDRGEI